MTELRIVSESVGPLQSNCIVLYNERTRSAVLVDPGWEASTIDKTIQHLKLTVKAILLTHVHFDNALYAGEFKKKYIQRYPPLKIMCHQADLFLWDSLLSTAKECGAETPKHFPCRPDETFDNCASWDIDGITLEVLHTPGHTPGSVCLLSDADKIVCTGDTLFANGSGRLDFPEAHRISHEDSIRRLRSRCPGYLIYPGHGPVARINESIPDQQLHY
ncbi:Hydroxyacylglutathione hydrolase [Giardia lamblia P15]|uniref:Hydroxyacylglutathione hydrolase n=1 Tax=Giardia intestinalis (strain P15) TaxID=658858 RepID=E1F608_GIAIA|nr:Hydroxyacylglutathione hydrolase [Giardia lamblia P15]